MLKFIEQKNSHFDRRAYKPVRLPSISTVHVYQLVI